MSWDLQNYLPYWLKFCRLIILSVKEFCRLKMMKFFKDFVTFHQQKFLTTFPDGEENIFFFQFFICIDFKIKLI